MEVMFLQRPEGSEHSPLGSSFSTPPPPPLHPTGLPPPPLRQLLGIATATPPAKDLRD